MVFTAVDVFSESHTSSKSCQQDTPQMLCTCPGDDSLHDSPEAKLTAKTVLCLSNTAGVLIECPKVNPSSKRALRLCTSLGLMSESPKAKLSSSHADSSHKSLTPGQCAVTTPAVSMSIIDVSEKPHQRIHSPDPLSAVLKNNPPDLNFTRCHEKSGALTGSTDQKVAPIIASPDLISDTNITGLDELKVAICTVCYLKTCGKNHSSICSERNAERIYNGICSPDQSSVSDTMVKTKRIATNVSDYWQKGTFLSTAVEQCEVS